MAPQNQAEVESYETWENQDVSSIILKVPFLFSFDDSSDFAPKVCFLSAKQMKNANKIVSTLLVDFVEVYHFGSVHNQNARKENFKCVLRFCRK